MKYIRMRIRDELTENLDKSMSKFEKLVAHLKPEDLDLQIQNKDGGWSVIEILRHIQNSERGMASIVKSVIEGGEGASKDFDLSQYNTRSNEKMIDMTLNQVVENMKKYRDTTISILNSVKEGDWEKEGRHANLNHYPVKRFFEIISWHQYNHLKPIMAHFDI